ncbi:hypothetical protein ACFE04_015678 [Oxalis oulophora]
MALALSTTSNNTSSMALQFLPSSSSPHTDSLLNKASSTLHMPRQMLNHHHTLTFARKRNQNSTISTSNKKKKKKSGGAKKSLMEEEDDPFEALFSQLEEDLKNDKLSNGDDEDINDDDVELLARQLEAIKNLAGELCLDRAVVLSLLRDPPPSLVMLSATLPDEPEPVAKVLVPEIKINLEETIIDVAEEDTTEPKKTKVKEPVHAMQETWSAKKRLKKVQVETMERVYSRSKRPTNAMVSSIVHVTNLPRQRVLKWFEDKRTEEGVPGSDHRGPYQRPVSESVFS